VISHPSHWIGPGGTPVSDPLVLKRLANLAIPPAWENVWAAEDEASRVQATGTDSRGRTQYRYSIDALHESSTAKFSHMLHFASTLPRLRARIAADLGAYQMGSVPDSRHLIAAIARLIDRGLFRVGNERYAIDNHTYGLTTLRPDQVELHGDSIHFTFVGKEHISHDIEVTDAAVAAIIRPLLDSSEPASSIWRTARAHIDSTHVNAYLHAIGGAPATAKVFRTWGATVAAAAVVAGAGRENDVLDPPRAESMAVRAAADLLGDTITVARNSYIHPHAFAAGHSNAVRRAVHSAIVRKNSRDVRHLWADPGIHRSVLAALKSEQDYGVGHAPATGPGGPA
jgi:DNA topoisomerase-1